MMYWTVDLGLFTKFDISWRDFPSLWCVMTSSRSTIAVCLPFLAIVAVNYKHNENHYVNQLRSVLTACIYLTKVNQQ